MYENFFTLYICLFKYFKNNHLFTFNIMYSNLILVQFLKIMCAESRGRGATDIKERRGK